MASKKPDPPISSKEVEYEMPTLAEEKKLKILMEQHDTLISAMNKVLSSVSHQKHLHHKGEVADTSSSKVKVPISGPVSSRRILTFAEKEIIERTLRGLPPR